MICSKCNKNLDSKYFEFRKDTKKYRIICRKCSKGYIELIQDRIEKIKVLFSQGIKQCGKCKEYLSLDKFHNDKNTLTGLTSACKDCKKQYSIDKKDQIINNRLKRKYNITLAKYNQLFENQNFRCAICKTTNPKGKNNKFHVDHDHKTGEVRGLLCHFCNNGLGNFNDSVESLKEAIKYLK